MSYEEYERLTKPAPKPRRTLLDVANEPGMRELFEAAAEIEFEIPPRTDYPREINFD